MQGVTYTTYVHTGYTAVLHAARQDEPFPTKKTKKETHLPAEVYFFTFAATQL